MKVSRKLTCGMVFAMIGLAAAAQAAEPWAVPEADGRVRLAVRGDLYTRERPDLATVIDFNDLLGTERVLAADSLTLRDVKSGEKVPLQFSQEAQIHYASGNPIIRLQWSAGRPEPFAERAWDLYFSTVKPDDPRTWKALTETFLSAKEGVLFSTSFETPNPQSPQSPAWFLPVGRDEPGEKSERVWADTGAHSGQRCLKIGRVFEGPPPANTNRPFWWSWPPPIPAAEGSTYRLEAWLRCVADKPNAEAILALEFVNEKQARMPGQPFRVATRPLVHEWQYLSGSATAPPGARGALLEFLLYGEGEAYCDDVTLTVVPGSTLPTLRVAQGNLEERATAAAGGREAPGQKKILRCGLAQQPPKLDGVLDDPCWQTAGRISDFETFSRVPGTAVTTTVLACADREALYFGFECTEPSTENLIARADKRDGPVWSDDSVELFLDTNLDRRTFYQIIVNSRGVFFDQDTGAPGLAGEKWNGPVTAAASAWPDRWTAEIKIEFTGLRLAEANGERWGANFARSSYRGGRSLYTWVKVGQNFGEPERFGTLLLPLDPTANAVTGRVLAGERLFCGEGTLPFEINNRRDRAVQTRVVISAETAQGLTTVGETRLSVPPRSTAPASVQGTLTQAGEVKLRYDLLQEPGGKLLYTTSLTHTIPEPLEVSPTGLVSYLDEKRLCGSWTLGLAEGFLSQSALVLSVTPKGTDKALLTQTIAPQATSGSFALAVGSLPPGAYQVRASLLQDGKVVGSHSFLFDRISGPFSEGARRQ